MRLPDLAEIDALRPDEVPAVLTQVAALQARLAVRLLATQRPVLAPVPSADRWLRAEAAATLIGWSTSAMRKRGHELPGFRRLSPGRVRWSERALREWLRGCAEVAT